MPDGRLAPSVLTWREAAALLRLDDDKRGRKTLEYYRRSGRLTGMKIGREFKYTHKDIERFLENQT
jgi:hypothetical protein